MQVSYSPVTNVLVIRVMATPAIINVQHISCFGPPSKVNTPGGAPGFYIYFTSSATKTNYISYGDNTGKGLKDEILEQRCFVQCATIEAARRCHELVARVLAESAVVLHEHDVFDVDGKVIDAAPTSGHTTTSAAGAEVRGAGCSA